MSTTVSTTKKTSRKSRQIIQESSTADTATGPTLKPARKREINDLLPAKDDKNKDDKKKLTKDRGAQAGIVKELELKARKPAQAEQSEEPGSKKRSHHPGHRSMPVFRVEDIAMVREQIGTAKLFASPSSLAGDIAGTSGKPPARQPPAPPPHAYSASPAPKRPVPPVPLKRTPSSEKQGSSPSGSAEASPRLEEAPVGAREKKRTTLKPLDGKKVHRLQPEKLSPRSNANLQHPLSVLPSVSGSHPAEKRERDDGLKPVSLTAIDNLLLEKLARVDASMPGESQSSAHSSASPILSTNLQLPSGKPASAKKFFTDLFDTHQLKLKEMGVKNTMDALARALPEDVSLGGSDLKAALAQAMLAARSAEKEFMGRAALVQQALALTRQNANAYFGTSERDAILQLLIMRMGGACIPLLESEISELRKHFQE